MVLFNDCQTSPRFSSTPGGVKMKKVVFVVLIMVFMLALATTAFAGPNPPPNPTGGSCNMGHSWWEPPDTGPGSPNPNGVQPGDRGMFHVHNKVHPEEYANGFTNMDLVTTAHCGT